MAVVAVCTARPADAKLILSARRGSILSMSYAMSRPSAPTAKVLFRVPNEDGGADVETLWAIDLGNNEYQLDNLPFYAYSVSWQDVVFAPYDATEGLATFQHVVRKSGNRTVRIILDEPPEPGTQAHQVLKGLEALGCGYEGAYRSYIAINIPADADLEQVCAHLTAQGVQWEHADPSYADVHGDDA